jgi:CheY-like chemotaxis protein
MAYKVMIVDDSKLARMAVIRALKGCCPDADHVEAGSAAEALGAAARDVPHIALVDFNMPGTDGLALVADLRKLNPEMPIAVISANHQQEIVQRAQALGAKFLPKPLTQSALADFVKVAVDAVDRAAS